MGSVNINRHVSDQFYRYKMPRLIAKVEGKGNGIKTVIVNMVDIAKALNRPPTYPTKYFGCELGAQTQFDQKNDRYIVNGSHEANRLQEMLDGFIKKFVLCPECDNPETLLAIHQKKQIITQQCIACGHQGNIDMRHKLTTFILKNPPNQEISTTPGSGKKKEKVRLDKNKKHNGEHNGSVSPTSPASGSAEHDDGTSAPARVSSENEDDWGEDTSQDAVIKRMAALSDGVKSLTLNEDLEKSQQERLDLLYNFVKNRLENNQLEGSDKEILAEAERLDVRDKGPLILVELLFDENMLQQINKHRILFLRFTHNNSKSQKYLLGGFEQLVGKIHKDTLLPKVPFLLKALYDADILDEEIILDWAKKPSKKYVSKQVVQEILDKAEPFIKWLKEAEEEPSSDDDDDDDEEEEEEDSEKEEENRRAKTYQSKEKIEDDIDIDAI